MIQATGAFVGIHDRTRPPSSDDVARLGDALDDGGPVRRWTSGTLALAWVGDPAPPPHPGGAGEPLVLLHGRIYNLDELEPGTGASDPLATAQTERGDDLLRRLRGDFVLLAYDMARGEGVLARDHMGGRGMVWRQRGGRLFFATEAGPLLRVLPSRPSPDPVGLAHWLALSGFPPGHTLYEGVQRLEAAHRLRFGARVEPPRRYWSPIYRRPSPTTISEAAATLRTLLTASVRRRCRDASVTGVLLSGGLDSSSVASIAARLDGPARLKRSYSATFPAHPDVDEGALISTLCRHLSLQGTRAVVSSGSAVGGAIEYIRHWGLPPISPNLFFWFPLLRRAAADGVSLLLDGEGGDELFGLSPYLIADRLGRGRVLAASDLVRRIPGGGRGLPRRSVRRYLRNYGLKGLVPPGVQDVLERARGDARRDAPWLRKPLLEAFVSTDQSSAWKRIPGPRWWAYLVNAATRGTGPSMAYDHVRRRAAQCGLEACHPLVDVDVVEYALAIPPELAYDERFSRPILREAMRGLLPEEVRTRPAKSGFDAVFHESLAGVDLPVVRALLDPADAAIGAFVDLDEVHRRLLTTPPSGRERQRWAISLWRLATAECWLRSQEAGPIEDGPLPTTSGAEIEIVG